MRALKRFINWLLAEIRRPETDDEADDRQW
ncbi:hypothetical protein ABIE87_006469 [Bradyrhizobium diazoefficiens]|jgi:hypothetical protein